MLSTLAMGRPTRRVRRRCSNMEALTHDDSWRPAPGSQLLRPAQTPSQLELHPFGRNSRTWLTKDWMRAIQMMMRKTRRTFISRKSTSTWRSTPSKTCTSTAHWSRCRLSSAPVSFRSQPLEWFSTTQGITCCTLSTNIWAGASSSRCIKSFRSSWWIMVIFWQQLWERRSPSSSTTSHQRQLPLLRAVTHQILRTTRLQQLSRLPRPYKMMGRSESFTMVTRRLHSDPKLSFCPMVVVRVYIPNSSTGSLSWNFGARICSPLTTVCRSMASATYASESISSVRKRSWL